MLLPKKFCQQNTVYIYDLTSQQNVEFSFPQFSNKNFCDRCYIHKIFECLNDDNASEKVLKLIKVIGLE